MPPFVFIPVCTVKAAELGNLGPAFRAGLREQRHVRVFRLFCTNEMQERIVKETNSYAHQTKKNGRHANYKGRKWPYHYAKTW